MTARSATRPTQSLGISTPASSPTRGEAIVAAAAEAGAQIQDASDDDVRLERIRTVFRDVNVVILTGANPIEVRAFGPLG